MLIFYVSLSVIISFICSLLEAIILSVSPSFLASLKSKNAKLYGKISYLKKDIERPLASILTFNTIAHTIGAAGAGAEAQKRWGNEYLTIFSAILTFIILFFSEIIPKSIGAKSWKVLLPLSYYFLRPMMVLSFPIVWISTKISALIQDEAEEAVTREEIPAIAELGLKSGAIQESEYNSLKSLLKFGDIKLKDILRPTSQVIGVNGALTISEAFPSIRHDDFSRLIVFGINSDDVKGYVMRKDILQTYIDKKDILISSISRKILILPHNTSGKVLFEKLLAMKAHIAAVIDDDGKFLGIVTLEDLIEKILGHNIYDEFDS